MKKDLKKQRRLPFPHFPFTRNKKEEKEPTTHPKKEKFSDGEKQFGKRNFHL